MKVIYCAVGEREIIDVANEYESLQELVNGYIEIVMLTENIVLVCNEEGKLLGLKPNCRIMYNKNVKTFDDICGNYFICRIREEDFESYRKGDWEKISTKHTLLRWGKTADNESNGFRKLTHQ